MKKIGLSVVFLLLIVGRIFLQARLLWGMGSDGMKYLGPVLLVESVFLITILLGAIYCLRDSKWPTWLVTVPAVLAMLSSPILFQFGESWADHGWQVSEVVELMNTANLGLFIFLVAFAFAPRWTADSTAID